MIALILSFARLLLPLIPTAAQRESATQAIADNYIKFLQTTDSSLYAAIRSLEILGALYDVFLNGGRMWAQASAALASNPFGVVELLILLWPFFGNSLSAFAVQALQRGLQGSGSGGKDAPGQPGGPGYATRLSPVSPIEAGGHE